MKIKIHHINYILEAITLISLVIILRHSWLGISALLLLWFIVRFMPTNNGPQKISAIDCKEAGPQEGVEEDIEKSLEGVISANIEVTSSQFRVLELIQKKLELIQKNMELTCENQRLKSSLKRITESNLSKKLLKTPFCYTEDAKRDDEGFEYIFKT